METVEVQKDEAITLHTNAKKSGKKLLEKLLGKKVFQKCVFDRIDNFNDVLDDHGITLSEFNSKCVGLSPDEIAYKQAKLIALTMNERWIPDYDDSNERKFEIRWDMSSSSGVGLSYYDFGYWGTNSFVGSRLCFKDLPRAKHAAQKFPAIYKILLTQ